MQEHKPPFENLIVEKYVRTMFSVTQMIADALLCTTLSALLITFRAQIQMNHYKYIDIHLYGWTTAIATLILIIGFARSGVYDPLRFASAVEILKTTAMRLAEVMLLLTGAFFILKISDSFSRFWLVAWGGLSLIALSGCRLIALHIAAGFARSGRLTKKLAVVGVNPLGRRLASRLATEGSGAHLVGLFDDGFLRSLDAPRGRNIEALEQMASEGHVDEIIVMVPPSASERIVELCRRFHPFPVALRILAPEGFEHFRVLDSRRYGDISTLLVVRKPLDEAAAIVKWLEDKSIAILCLVAALPLMLFIALAIKLDSCGPVFFRQKRLGANNRPFDLLKFRSMYVERTDPLGSQATRPGDPRVTRVGRFLRSTSLDELPQLINVLRGDMSLVGPRPHALGSQAGGVLFVKAVDDYPLRHRVKPGMTGWAQVNGWRGEATKIEQLKGRLECDLYYVENWSLTFDLLILGRTLFTVLSRANAV